MAGDLSSNKKKAFEDLLVVDVLRGPHSTGAGVVNRFNGSKMDVTKSVGPPIELLTLKEYQDMMKGQFKAFIGHNRYATTGKISDANAHPFMFSHILGAHNGTIEYMCKNKLHNSNLYDTDSEAIFSHMNEHGLDDTFRLIDNPTYNTNAWALTWYNAEDNTINFARNSKRPLYYMYSADHCSLFWASEADMLRWVLKRNNIKTDEDKLYVFTEDHHYKWEVPKGLNDKFAHPSMRKLEKPAPIVSMVSSFRPNNNDNKFEQTISSFLDKKKKARMEIDTKKWRPPYKDYDDKVLSRDKLLPKIADGCTFCAPSVAADFRKNFKWGDFVFFLKPDSNNRPMFLCEDCYNDEDIRKVCEELI